MKAQEVTAIRETAKEHFNGNITKAAAAHVFGLGVVKMKKGIPGHATDEERAQVKAIVDKLGAGTKTKAAAPAKTAVSSGTAKGGKKAKKRTPRKR